MKFGICTSPSASLPDRVRQMSVAGADYLEFPVSAVMAEDWESLASLLESAPIKVEAFNCFIPPQHRITGPGTKLNATLEYCSTALPRCRSLGCDVVVLGSGGARRIPESFDPAEAMRQFTEFCVELAPIAESAGIDICIEPLNRREDNLINDLSTGAKVVDAVSHRRIRLLADLYHMEEDGEPMDHIVAAGNRLRHAHLADKGRLAPGYAKEGEADFRGFFKALRAARYGAASIPRCSFEGHFGDASLETAPLLALLRSRWEETR